MLVVAITGNLDRDVIRDRILSTFFGWRIRYDIALILQIK
jgi:hypothetical protein